MDEKHQVGSKISGDIAKAGSVLQVPASGHDVKNETDEKQSGDTLCSLELAKAGNVLQAPAIGRDETEQKQNGNAVSEVEKPESEGFHKNECASKGTVDALESNPENQKSSENPLNNKDSSNLNCDILTNGTS